MKNWFKKQKVVKKVEKGQIVFENIPVEQREKVLNLLLEIKIFPLEFLKEIETRKEKIKSNGYEEKEINCKYVIDNTKYMFYGYKGITPYDCIFYCDSNFWYYISVIIETPNFKEEILLQGFYLEASSKYTKKQNDIINNCIDIIKGWTGL